jgi:NTP pyrophosphatase (non-canonical NTP hydrolase)
MDLRCEAAVARDRGANPTQEGSISQAVDKTIAEGFTDVADRLEVALSSTQPSPESGSEVPDPGDFARQVVDAHNQLDRVSIPREEHDLPTRTSELVDRYIGSFEKARDLAQPESGSGEEGERNGLPDHHLLGTALCNVKHERFEQERLKAEGRFRFTCADHELSQGEKLAILTEEVGEVAQQVLEQPDRRLAFDTSGSRVELREELTQVAAVAVAWIESLFDVPPLEPTQKADGEWVRSDDYTALQAQLQRSQDDFRQQQEKRLAVEAKLQRVEEERDEERKAKAGETAAYNNANERATQLEAQHQEAVARVESWASECRDRLHKPGPYKATLGAYESVLTLLRSQSSSEVGEGRAPRLGYDLAKKAMRDGRRIRAKLSCDRGHVEGSVISVEDRYCLLDLSGIDSGKPSRRVCWAELDGCEILPASPSTPRDEGETR